MTHAMTWSNGEKTPCECPVGKDHTPEETVIPWEDGDERV